MQVTDAMVEAALANLPNRHLMNKTGVRAALTAALVDVPAVESVAGYRRRLPQYAFEHYEFEQPGYESPSISDWETLYTHQPHREGEDSAEAWPEVPTGEMLRALFTLNSGTARTTDEVTAVYRQLRTLAATRSASTITSSGTSAICQRGESE